MPATAANLGAGFDCLALALDLRLTVDVLPGTEALALDLPAGTPPEWTDPERNLVARAYAAGCAERGAAAPTGRLRITAPIPVARGLGSSAAAVVAGLGAADVAGDGRLAPERLLTLAAELEGHPDNAAAALLGGCTVTVHDGAAGLIARRIPVPPRLEAVLFVPDHELATASARAVLPAAVPLADAVFNAGRCALLVQALATGDLAGLGPAMEDRWHQPARSGLLPWLPRLIAAARAAGAHGACLSGAGPTVLALVPSHPATIAAVSRALEAEAASSQLAGRARVLAIADRGLTAHPLPGDGARAGAW